MTSSFNPPVGGPSPHLTGWNDAREAAAKIAAKEAKPIDCDYLTPMDPTTGVVECSLANRGRDCLCAEREETAERIVAAIRALEPPTGKSWPDWNWMARIMQRAPWYAKGYEEELEAALKEAANGRANSTGKELGGRE